MGHVDYISIIDPFKKSTLLLKNKIKKTKTKVASSSKSMSYTFFKKSFPTQKMSLVIKQVVQGMPQVELKQSKDQF